MRRAFFHGYFSRRALREGYADHLAPRVPPVPAQMEEEGVPSTALREVSLLQMLSESAFIVRYDPRTPSTLRRPEAAVVPIPPRSPPPTGFSKTTRGISLARRATATAPARTAVSGALLAPCARRE